MAKRLRSVCTTQGKVPRRQPKGRLASIWALDQAPGGPCCLLGNVGMVSMGMQQGQFLSQLFGEATAE